MSKKSIVLLLFSCVYICLGSEQKLVEDIFKGYERRLRPVKNASTITTVGVELMIIRLLEVVSESSVKTSVAIVADQL